MSEVSYIQAVQQIAFDLLNNGSGLFMLIIVGAIVGVAVQLVRSFYHAVNWQSSVKSDVEIDHLLAAKKNRDAYDELYELADKLGVEVVSPALRDDVTYSINSEGEIVES